MRDWVSEWAQEGRLHIWRYATPNHNWRGWHLTADPDGCRSLRNLLDRLQGGDACHRTLKLERVTDAILSVSSYSGRCSDQFAKLRVDYEPSVEDLLLSPEGDRLTMTLGICRLRKLSAALTEVERGGGDFSIATSSDRKAELFWFWWMPGINYLCGKRV